MEKVHLKGIGGWLILVIIGMFGSLIQAVFYLNDIIEPNYPEIRITVITYITGAHHPTYGVWLLYKIALNVIVIFSIAFLLILLFTKNRFFPRMTIAYLIIVSFLQGIYVVLGYMILSDFNSHPSANGLIGTLVISAVTIPYLNLSKRVKATYLSKDYHSSL